MSTPGRSGAMRHRLTFQSRNDASDGLGPGGDTAWVDTLMAWPAEQWNVSGSERVEAARNKQPTIYRWRVRHSASITPDMRIKWVDGSTTHYQEIKAVNPLDDRHQYLEVLAEEKKP